MTTAASSGEFLHIVVGYDGSPPATRALDAAVSLLRGRTGRIEVVWVAHLSSTVMMPAGAVAEMEQSFDELAPEMRDQAAGQLDGSGLDWGFERRQGIIADELIAAAAGLRDARPGAAHPSRRAGPAGPTRRAAAAPATAPVPGRPPAGQARDLERQVTPGTHDATPACSL